MFHYGFRDRTAFIVGHPHYYPPAKLEDRFDQIVLPLLASLADTHSRSAVPDLVSVTPGFWGMMRQGVEDDRLRQAEVADGMDEGEADKKWDTWRSMPPEVRAWNEGRIGEVVRHVGKAWAGEEARPRILWRALHHIKVSRDWVGSSRCTQLSLQARALTNLLYCLCSQPHHVIPGDRLQSLDQIGRAVVEQLVLEGLAAEQGGATWQAWVRRQGKKWLPTKWAGSLPGLASSGGLNGTDDARAGEEEEGEEARGMGLGRRLKIDEWGTRMLGQENHFRDEVHPLPLPGSWLYGNMLMVSATPNDVRVSPSVLMFCCPGCRSNSSSKSRRARPTRSAASRSGAARDIATAHARVHVAMHVCRDQGMVITRESGRCAARHHEGDVLGPLRGDATGLPSVVSSGSRGPHEPGPPASGRVARAGLLAADAAGARSAIDLGSRRGRKRSSQYWTRCRTTCADNRAGWCLQGGQESRACPLETGAGRGRPPGLLCGHPRPGPGPQVHALAPP